mmetsp:Transcript_17766/g.42231  ORF Transcript_17766/g.42231 Transcript_17766/m.42231 type:complete len:302 (-) Transcript_17766:91-996(-)
MVLLRSVSAVLSLLLGGKASIVARPPADAPLALLSARCEEFSFSITEGRRILPFNSLTIEGESVQLGWKAPALLLAPLWLILAPRLLPLLLTTWLAAPSGPTGGLLFFDSLVREKDLARGAWPAVLSAVLTAITRASLPALLIELADAADGTAPQDPLGLRSRVPSSECVGASVAGTKLVFEGRVNAVQGQPPLAYTLRTGVSPHHSALGFDGITPLASECSSLCWEEPELRLSLGETGLVGMLPKLWLPVADAGGVRLPPSVHLTRASVSEAAAGLRASGTIQLGGAPKVSGGGLVTVIH